MATTPFVILTSQRSGSTFLRLWLNGHPEIRAHSEMFLSRNDCPEDFFGYLKRGSIRKYCAGPISRGAHIPAYFKRLLVERYLKQLFSEAPPSFPSVPRDTPTGIDWHVPEYNRCDARAVGFNLMYNHLQRFDLLADWIRRNRVSVIHLVRTNSLDVMISAELARKRDKYHSLKHDDDAESIKVSLSPEVVVSDIKRMHAAHHQYAEWFSGSVPYILITYNSITGHESNLSYRKIVEFLQCEPLMNIPPPTLQKMNPIPPEERLENYSEISATLDRAGLTPEYGGIADLLQT